MPKKYEGELPVHMNTSPLNVEVWDLIQHGPVELSVGEDFTDAATMVHWQRSVGGGGYIAQRAKKLNKRVTTRRRGDSLIVWLVDK